MKRLIFLAWCNFLALHLFSQASPAAPKLSGDSLAKAITDSTALYGLIPQRPIKVGGGPVNQRKYLERLRDAQGNKISYERKGSCCEYKSDSPEALFGMGMLDIYEIKYRDAANEKKKINVYISFYDFEEPKSIKGFTLTSE